MDRKELKASVKKAYSKGYHDGFNDACDTIMLANHKAMIDLIVDMKKSLKESEVEVVDEYEEEE